MTIIVISGHCFCAFNRHSPSSKCMEMLTLNHLFKKVVPTPKVNSLMKKNYRRNISGGQLFIMGVNGMAIHRKFST